MAQLQACQSCGVAFDIDWVKRNPTKVCAVCGAPLDKKAAELVFVEAGNPSNPTDAQRLAATAQHVADVAAMEATRAPAPVTPVTPVP